MGRHIPAKKHRGVRDPIKQRREREAKIKHLVNAPPKETEKLPKKVQRIASLCQQAKGKELVKNVIRRKKKVIQLNADGLPLISTSQFLKTNTPGMKNLPTLTQQPWETDKMFYERFQQLSNDVIKESQFEKKFDMQVKRDERGQIEALHKAPENEVDKKGKEMAKEAKLATKNPKKVKKLRAKERKKAAAKEVKLEKLKNYRKTKKEKKLERILAKKEDEPVRDVVKFGDIVHKPPDIKVRPRKSDTGKDLRCLMFNQMLIEGKRKEEEESGKKKTKTGQAASEVDYKGKWKNLPAGSRRIMEDQQKNAIAVYRLMKAKKANSVKVTDT